jgi:hypothetical protein
MITGVPDFTVTEHQKMIALRASCVYRHPDGRDSPRRECYLSRPLSQSRKLVPPGTAFLACLNATPADAPFRR